MADQDFTIGDLVEFTMALKLPWAGRVLSGSVVRVNRQSLMIEVILDDNRPYYFNRLKSVVRKHTI